ncbi:MAG TPA: alpha-amylase family protein [Longimicrobiaceae bacterium]|nr:alpha-amylase family protein [Longimicrobiaceae bacterium]
MIEDLWYKNTVVYSLDVESFLDANGDGIGDFEGLMRRLDYLQALGVGAVWLAPFQPSPDRDDGYDVSDYYGVDPRYGSSGDFVEFMHQAEKRGIRVLIDLVVNHTSHQHRWFQEARRDPESKYRDWYTWSKKRPSDWNSGMVFPGVQESTWSYDRQAKAYYYHRFYEFQPDLNMDNPAVRTEVRRIMGYWLQQGVAGFRVDAVPFVIESTVPGKAQGELHFDYLAEMRRFLQWRVGDAILLGEANVVPEETERYFGEDGGSGIHMMFNFWVNQRLFYALATADVAPLVDALLATREIPRTSQWAQFLRNHDELDLGRLTDEQRAQVFARFGPEERMQLYGRGIRRRLAPMLGDRPQLELAYSLLFSLPGTPVIRYGDEIGMGDDLSLDERAAVRTPMQWSDEPHGGFTTSDKPVEPVIDDGIWGYRRVNVEAQHRDPDSLLNWTARMIRMRKECPEIGWGSWEILDTGCPQALAMRYDWRGNSLVVVHNFDTKPHEVILRPGVEGGDRLVNLRLEEESLAGDDGAHRIVMDAFGYHWYRVGGLNYALRRERA